MNYKGGIHIDSELKKYQEKARKWDKILSLAKEENQIKSRVRQIGQERAKLLGLTDKYKEQK